MPFNLSTDETLLVEKLSRDDDRTAFEAIYNQYFIQVYHCAFRFVGDRQVAEDIALETFAKLWDKRAGLEAGSKLGAWLYTIARNASLNHMRNEQRRSDQYQELASLTPATAGLEDLTDPRSEIYRRLYLEIEQLPGKMGEVMLLSLKGRKNGEIALTLGIAEKTVRNLKTEAIKQLRASLLRNELLLLLLLLSRG